MEFKEFVPYAIAIVNILTLIFLIIQLKTTTCLKRDEFIHKLNETLNNFIDLHEFLIFNRNDTVPNTIKLQALHYMIVFEGILLLYEDGFISESDFQEYFGSRLRAFLSNKQIADACSNEWEFKSICESLKQFAVSKHRKVSRKPIYIRLLRM